MTQPETNHQWPQYLATLTATLLSVSTGIHFGWPSPALPKLINNDLNFPVSREQASYMIMISPLGYIVGCSITALILDRIGRKVSLLVLAGPQILAWLLIALSTNVGMLYIAKLIASISEGGTFTSVPVYICEIAEPKVRGALGLIFSVAFIFGSLLITCYGSYMSLRSSAYISISVPLLFLVTFVWMPPSPYYCIMTDNTENARSALRKLRGTQNVEEELTKLIADVRRQTSEPSSIKDIFTIRSNFKALLILMALRTLQQFSGGASIQFYNQIIFQQADRNLSFTGASVIYHVALVVSSGGCSFVIDRAGRRPLLIASTVVSGCCLFIEGLYFTLQHHNVDVSSITWIPVSTMIFYTASRGIGLLTIPSLMAGELFSASIKAKAVGLVNIHFAICISLSSKLFQSMADGVAMYTPFYFFCFCCCIGMLFVYFCVPETKGKTLEEIQQHLKGNIVDEIEE